MRSNVVGRDRVDGWFEAIESEDQKNSMLGVGVFQVFESEVQKCS